MILCGIVFLWLWIIDSTMFLNNYISENFWKNSGVALVCIEVILCIYLFFRQIKIDEEKRNE